MVSTSANGCIFDTPRKPRRPPAAAATVNCSAVCVAGLQEIVSPERSRAVSTTVQCPAFLGEKRTRQDGVPRPPTVVFPSMLSHTDLAISF